MPVGDFLKTRGKRFLEEVDARRVEFLIEVDLADYELDELFQNLQKVTFFGTEPTTRACLTVAAVHAANQARPGDSSFINLFFERLGRRRDDGLWNEVYGPAIERCLNETFQESPRIGPYRFVGAVYRHSGVPIHGIGSFASLLQRLTATYGYQFTRHEYDSCCEARVTGLASEFLSSEVGYEYTLDTARVLQQIQSGLVSETADVPGYPKGFWTAVLGRTQFVHLPRQRPSRVALPKLAIDLDRWSFGIRIPPSAMRIGVKCGVRRITSEWDPILHGEELYRVGAITWRLPWSPSDGYPAVFSTGDGSFVRSSDVVTIPPGEYILVQRWDLLPPSEIISEDIGYCDWTGNPPLRAWRIQVPVGFRGPTVAAASDSVPSIGFSAGHHAHAFGPSVFLDSLPDLVVHNWGPDAERRFAICLEDETGTIALSPDAERHVKIHVPCPSTGAIRMIPKGRSRETFDELPYLPFTVIPSAIHILGPRQLTSVGSDCTISAQLPDGWSITWDRLTPSSTNRWTVPPHTWIIDGNLSFRDISVRISWRVPRIDVRLRTRYDLPNIIWRDEFDMSATVNLQAPPQTRFSLHLQSATRDTIVQDLDPIPPNGIYTIRCVALRDALNEQAAPVLELRLMMESCAFRTNVYWVNHVATLLEALDCPDSQQFIEGIPGLGSCLATIRSMRCHALEDCSLDLALRDTPLRRTICECGVLAGSLDGTCVEPSEREMSPFASEALVNLAAWYREAKEAIGRPQHAGKARDAFPGGTEAIPFQRWRDAVVQLLSRLQSVSNLPALIAEWRDEVRRYCAGPAVSLIRQRPDGEALTQGAVKYLRSFEAPSDIQRQLARQGAARLMREAQNSPDELIRELATALWWLIIYRVGVRPSDLQPDLAAWLAPAKATIRRLFGLSSEPTAANNGGLHVRDISPADEDKEFEVSEDA
ncbi:MAG: hypothetical protein ABSH32_08800 [Bryobacteraceae bacterium]|jgi:hypothetical protein